uniref:Uncharacterized protein n=2 Tax=Cetacea TaxID=9721 RepID=A0A8C9BX19_PHOSS
MGTQASRGSPHPLPLPCAPPPLTFTPAPRLHLGTPPRVVFICLLTQPKETSTLHTCIKEIKCYF